MWDFAAVEDLVTDDAYPGPDRPVDTRRCCTELRSIALAEGWSVLAAS